ncbi:hypothetical protein ACQ4PT_011410 [Festuca glaucescens]
MSRPLVHAVEVEGPAGLPEGPQAGVRMDDVPGKPGTRLGLFFRSLQFICASITLTVTVTTDFTAIPALCYQFALFVEPVNGHSGCIRVVYRASLATSSTWLVLHHWRRDYRTSCFHRSKHGRWHLVLC